MKRILERAGISKGSLYYYFEDKRDLFETVVEVAIERWLAAVGGLRVSELEREDLFRDMLAAEGARTR